MNINGFNVLTSDSYLFLSHTSTISYAFASIPHPQQIRQAPHTFTSSFWRLHASLIISSFVILFMCFWFFWGAWWDSNPHREFTYHLHQFGHHARADNLQCQRLFGYPAVFPCCHPMLLTELCFYSAHTHQECTYNCTCRM